MFKTCSECVCRFCLYWWSYRCPYGECYDDHRAVVNPHPSADGTAPPRKLWSEWNRPGEQAHWCRGGSFTPAEDCDHFIQYEGQSIEQCHRAMTSVFQDGYRECNMMVNGSCECCLSDLNERLKNG